MACDGFILVISARNGLVAQLDVIISSSSVQIAYCRLEADEPPVLYERTRRELRIQPSRANGNRVPSRPNATIDRFVRNGDIVSRIAGALRRVRYRHAKFSAGISGDRRLARSNAVCFPEKGTKKIGVGQITRQHASASVPPEATIESNREMW